MEEEGEGTRFTAQTASDEERRLHGGDEVVRVVWNVQMWMLE